MWFLYHLTIRIYLFSIRIASLFSDKARKWVDGRKDWKKHLADRLPANRRMIWMHCASLGEFEMGRPVIERLREDYPDYGIVITFFSPSGYEIRKNYSGADVVCYLPADLPGNARDFIGLVNPQLAIFVKYEFWFGYLKVLKEKGIPSILISGRFRKEQHFFQKYGHWFRQQIQQFSLMHVQDESSADLLKAIGFQPVIVSGDTRYDRVYENTKHPVEIPVITKWLNGRQCLIAGSTWSVDDALMLPWKNPDIKLIIAPHEINQTRIKELMEKAGGSCITFSELQKNDQVTSENRPILIIDNIGMLLSIYAVGTIAYVGGAFGSGLHNILEPAASGLPVLFGPKHDKFPEAEALESAGCAKTIHHQEEFLHAMNFFLEKDMLMGTSGKCKHFVETRIGATSSIMASIKKILAEK